MGNSKDSTLRERLVRAGILLPVPREPQPVEGGTGVPRQHPAEFGLVRRVPDQARGTAVTSK